MTTAQSTSIYDFTAKSIAGEEISLDRYRGKVVLVVNVASRCVFTWQYTPLQALYDKYREQGLVILGFPCNQFAGQEPKGNDAIQSFCSLTYHVTFPMFEKIEVNGANAHPLFAHLKSSAKGWLGSESIKWNFTKFLVDREGQVVARYSPSTSPKTIERAIEQQLASLPQE
jgi:glutathione peroxidase